MAFINIIVAADRNDAIGKNGTLPWHLSSDLKRFKRMTYGEIVVMGRKTFESIGHPLPGRRNIVLSRTMQPTEGVEIVRSKEELLREFCTDDLWIIGGAELYKTFMPIADCIYLTRVETKVEGADTFCPPFDPKSFTLILSVLFKKRVHDDFDHTYEVYKRKY